MREVERGGVLRDVNQGWEGWEREKKKKRERERERVSMLKVLKVREMWRNKWVQAQRLKSTDYVKECKWASKVLRDMRANVQKSDWGMLSEPEVGINME